MVVLEPVISVRELPPSRARLRQHLPSLRDLVRDHPSVHEPAILAYLAQGVVCGIHNEPGLMHDVLQPGRRLHNLAGLNLTSETLTIQPSLVLTDGVWVWSGVLGYYVGVYHIQLPERFLRFAEERQWKIDPSTINLDDLNTDAYDAVPGVIAIDTVASGGL
jgi:hypothetical protein